MNTGFPGRVVTSKRIQPASAIVLALGLALAVLSERYVPELWTKAVLGAMILPTMITALWLTAPRAGDATEDGLGPQRA